MATRAPAGEAKRSQIARGGPYVHLDGGPYHGANYTVSDWETTREAERWGIEEAGEQREPVLGLYRRTDKMKAYDSEHRDLPGLTATVWRWSGRREPLNAAGRRART